MLEVCRPLLIGDHKHLLREAALLRTTDSDPGPRHADGARGAAGSREAAGSIAHATDWPDIGEPESWPEVSRPAFDEIGSKQGAEFVIENWKEGPAFHDMGAIDPEPGTESDAAFHAAAHAGHGGEDEDEAEAGFAAGHAHGMHRAPSATGGRASVKYIKQGVGLIRTGHAAALVTAPISKTSLRLASIRYPGHTELLADLCGMEPHEAGMLFVTPQFKAALLSVHAPLKDAIADLTQEEIVHRLALLHVEHARWFGGDPRIAVAALNPHAGEEGMFGEEERSIIAPAIDAAREAGIDARGPYPADTVFTRTARGEFDCVLALYHDQATIAVKTSSFGQAVNMTIGLPFLRTSVDHGTAWDIAGTGAADPSSLIEALVLAARLAPRVHR
ncbi:MAG TPA: 4-hydroxythreonine-4-phosphate dehydrogenase PdxA [Verrucomicrobiae bacterium]|nr:4-hydroxythreonine-4-phosphate dehydrogenase PdxA [Verrucomicrobiae bacterium]